MQSNETKDIKSGRAKRTAKNSVFLDLFKNKKYLLELYRTLHPEDTEATEDSLKNITINNVLTDNMYNDLGFLVGSRLMILVEAQSTWTVNILIRILLYLAESYRQYFVQTRQNLYKSQKAKMPEPELYIIYTGKRRRKQDVISLSEEFFGGKKIGLEIKAKVIYENGQDDIINQYIVFCKVFNEQIAKYGMTMQAVEETIRICKDGNILKEYLESRETEVMAMMDILFDDDVIMELYVADRVREAFRGTVERMIRSGKFTLEEIAEYAPEWTVEDIREFEEELLQTS